MEEAINRLKGLLSWSDRIGSDEIHEINSIIHILKKNSNIVWIEQLQPIIDEYGEGEPLDEDDVDRLIEIIRAKINFNQGNITEDEYNSLLDFLPKTT